MNVVISSAVGFVAVALGAMAADELSLAREALRDGLWEVARRHSGTNASEEARLVILESFASEGKWDDVGKRLAEWKGAKGDGFDYYRAIVKGDHARAMDILKRGGSAEGCVAAGLFEANELAKRGDLKGARALWRSILSGTNLPERVWVAASANLMDAELLRRAYSSVKSPVARRQTGLRLGVALLSNPKTIDEGERLVRALAGDAPDTEGAREAFLALADSELARERWQMAANDYLKAIETWPDTARLPSVQEGRGWAFRNLGRREEALMAFRMAGTLASDDETRAVALLKEGDVLSEMGRGEEALASYRAVLTKYPSTKVAKGFKSVVEVRELEARGHELYRNFKFAEAQKVFSEVKERDVTRRARMAYYSCLCLYGQGREAAAEAGIKALIAENGDGSVVADAMFWLAKHLYNRREWKGASETFEAASGRLPSADAAAEALMWASRAALADGSPERAIQLSTRFSEKFPESGVRMRALLVQGEALLELARFDEAVLLLERVAGEENVAAEERSRALRLKADALYAMGADNPSRYAAALEAYRAIRFGGALSAGEQVVISFRIARTLERLGRMDEAVDQYYSQVVMAYRDGRFGGVPFTEEARTVFTRAAFRLVDEYESRGKDEQAVNILRLVAGSDVPAANEAVRRIERIERKGRFL